jgi:hypothetical protein
MKLDADDIEALAARVVALLRDETDGARRYVDAATLARLLSVRRGWVYAHARELGGVRLVYLATPPEKRSYLEAHHMEALLDGAGQLDGRHGTLDRDKCSTSVRPTRAR